MDNGIDIVLEEDELEVEIQADFLKGDKGETGYTPVKGVDYYTEKEKEELVNELTEDINQAKDDFNTNVIEKTSEFNNNTISKVEEYNANASDKIEEYNANTEELINKVAELQEQNSELQAENERLKQDLNGLPTGTLSGETIHITDSAEMRFSEFNVRGNSKQESREGYNLIGLKDGTYSFNGITAVVLNGEVTLNGTATTVTFASIPLINEITLKQSTLYQMYAFNNTITDAVIFRPNETDGNRQTSFTSINNVVGYQNNQASATLTKVTFRIANGINLVNVKCKPMIIEGNNTTLTYEQYGASPSPDYPSEVESNGDNVNLIDLDNMVSGYVSSSGSFANHLNQGEKRSDFIKVSPNTSYTFKIHETSQKNNDWIGIGEYSSNDVSTFIQRDVKGGSSTSFTEGLEYTITTSPTTQYIVVSSRNLAGATKIKLEEGSTPTPYSPYGQGCINEVICNENLFDGINRNYYINTGATLAGVAESDIGGYVDVSKLEQVTISSISVQGRFRVGLTNELSNSMTLNSGINLDSNTSKKTTIDTTNYKYLIINANNLNVIKVEKGSEAKEYVAHQSQKFSLPTQQPMRAIGDIRDTFVKVDGKWFERHLINKVILDGINNKFNTKVDITANNLYYSNVINDVTVPTSNNVEMDLLSNYFNKTTANNLYTNDLVGCALTTGKTFSIGFGIDSDINTLDLANAWLQEQYNAGTPVYVDYILATPTDIECTEEQVAILDEIDNTVKSYKGVTHIYSTDNVSSNVKVTYKKDIETLFNALAGSGV